jgi:hypothetical protein
MAPLAESSAIDDRLRAYEIHGRQITDASVFRPSRSDISKHPHS